MNTGSAGPWQPLLLWLQWSVNVRGTGWWDLFNTQERNMMGSNKIHWVEMATLSQTRNKLTKFTIKTLWLNMAIKQLIFVHGHYWQLVYITDFRNLYILLTVDIYIYMDITVSWYILLTVDICTCIFLSDYLYYWLEFYTWQLILVRSFNWQISCHQVTPPAPQALHMTGF